MHQTLEREQRIMEKNHSTEKHRSSSHRKHHRTDSDNHRIDADHHHRGHRREGSRERKRHDREGSRERSYDREKSHDREGSRERSRRDRSDSAERKSQKRKYREEEEDEDKDGYEKRARVTDERRKAEDGEEDKDGYEERDRGGERKRYEDGKEERRRRSRRDEDDDFRDDYEKRDRDERRSRRRFDDKVKREGEDDEERRSRRKFEDKAKDEVMEDGKEERRSRRKFGEKVKREGEDEQVDVGGAMNGEGSGANGAVMEPPSISSQAHHETSLAPSHSSPIKVSSISTTHENKGVNSNRSHEVPGKSSTDGTASNASKTGGLSLDVIAKAKKTLQMQKELKEKLKKIPLFDKATDATADSSWLSKEVPKGSSSSTGGILPTPVQSVTSAVISNDSAASKPIFPEDATSSAKASASALPQLAGLTAPKFEAVKRAQELAAKMGFRQDPEFAPLINMFPGQMPPEVIIQPRPAKAPVLRLDAQGREIDEHGNLVNVPKITNLSTLKVNINKQKKEAFQILKPELEVDPEKNPHFDPRMGIDKTKLLRPKRMAFQFVEEGKWSKEAEMIKLRSQFGEAQARELRAKQAQLAKAKAEPDINPNLIEVSERIITKEKAKEPIPEVEWWDVPLLKSGTYGDIAEGSVTEDMLKMEKITIYVEHPRPIEPPAEPAPPPPQPLKLTPKERKKLRTQRRVATEKNKQEMIRQGLLEPPKPKVKMSNLMKVLGSEATQDPTRLEMEIRSAAAEREQAHVDRNIARKLTPAEKRKKKERKLFDDPNTLETIVSVFKINDLSNPKNRFKVDINAQENRLTGCGVISDGICVVAVEGGKKSIKRYQKLMLQRIDWAAKVENADEDEDEEDKPVNKCVLVWQGSVAKASFNRFSMHECRTEAAARKIFADAGVGHYWDFSVKFTEDQ